MEKTKKTFEENLEELEKIVKDLENGDIPLDDAIDKFKIAMDLSKECNKTLDEATKVVSKVLNENNELEDFKIEE